jgi:hypothetical protein
MPLWLWIARSVAAAILGTVIFLSFLSFLVVNHVTGKLLDPNFYTEILDQHDAYNFIYDEMLLDDEVRDSTRELTGDLHVISHEEIVELAREVVPPEYIQAQVEVNIRRAISYLSGEEDTLELQIDLGPPLARVQPILLAEIDRRIDELETVGPDPSISLREQAAQAQEVTAASLQSLLLGRIPEAVPSIKLIPGPFRASIFDILLPNLLNEIGLDPRVRTSLERSTPDLRREFIAGDTHQFLKVTARAVLIPLVDDAIAQFRQNLDDQDRLDVIQTVAHNSSSDTTEASLRADIAAFRDQITQARRWGETVALPVGIGATVVMVLIYLPSLTNALRWPGLTLLLTGLVIYTLGKIVENSLPPRLDELIEENISQMSSLPPSAMELTTDLLQAGQRQLIQGVGEPALVLFIVGAVLFAASFLVLLLRPVVPGIR